MLVLGTLMSKGCGHARSLVTGAAFGPIPLVRLTTMQSPALALRMRGSSGPFNLWLTVSMSSEETYITPSGCMPWALRVLKGMFPPGAKVSASTAVMLKVLILLAGWFGGQGWKAMFAPGPRGVLGKVF